MHVCRTLFRLRPATPPGLCDIMAHSANATLFSQHPLCCAAHLWGQEFTAHLPPASGLETRRPPALKRAAWSGATAAVLAQGCVHAHAYAGEPLSQHARVPLTPPPLAPRDPPAARGGGGSWRIVVAAGSGRCQYLSAGRLVQSVPLSQAAVYHCRKWSPITKKLVCTM